MERSPSLWSRSLAEFIGTALLVLIGPGTGAFYGTIIAKTHQSITLADLGVISFAFAIIVAAMIYTFGHISGCHINPAVTIGLATVRRFPWNEVPAYLIAQLAGAVVGGLGILVVLGSDGAVVGNLGATVLAPSTGYIQAITIEAITTFVLMIVIMGTAVDSRAPNGFAGLIIGLTVGALIMMAVGPAGGPSLNPARTFGPYVIDSLLGGKVHWIEYPIFVIGPLIGSIAAALTYQVIAFPKPAYAVVETVKNQVAEQ